MTLKFPYFNDSDIGYVDFDFLDDEEFIFIDSEEEIEEIENQKNENK